MLVLGRFRGSLTVLVWLFVAHTDATLAQTLHPGSLDTSFAPHAQMRYAVVVEGQPARGCVPMAQVRKDLVDPGRPTSEVQLLTVWFRESQCGAKWNEPPPATPSGRGNLCDGAIPLLREMDWAAVRRAFDWPAIAPPSQASRGFGAVNPGRTRDVVQRATLDGDIRPPGAPE